MTPENSTTSSIAGLLRELRDEAGTLLRQQVTLAKVELQENFSRLAGHAAQIAVGGLVAFAGSIVIFMGLGYLVSLLLIRVGLEPGNAQWLGLVLVGALVAITGALLLGKAMKALAQDPLSPRKTVESLRTDGRWAQEKLQTSHESTN
jgi:hypothetical protein